jgi:hypothetical protein
LDLFTPSAQAPTPAASKVRPILVFAYGGAFVMGDRNMGAVPGDLVYRNVGYFFAEKLGFETIVMDYRLLSHGAKYPSGGEDVALVMNWVADRYKSFRTKEVFLMGNSAGAVHVATYLFEQRFSERRKSFVNWQNGVKLRAAVFLSCPLRWDMDRGMRDMLNTYYGGETEAKEAEATALMDLATKDLSVGDMGQWPKILTAVAELDPEDMMIAPAKEFAQIWNERGGIGNYIEFEGHNRLSPPLSLGTGIAREELWSFQLAEWMTKARV